jgi:replicative DNA helicase
MIDLALLRVIKYKEQFDKVYRYIPNSAIDKRTRAIAHDIKRYFELHPDEERIDIEAFRSLFFTLWHRNLKEDDCEYYNKILTQIERDEPEAIKKSLVNQLLELEFATRAGNIIEEYHQGEDIDVVPQITQLCEEVRSTLERSNNFEYAELCEDLMVDDLSGSGLKWALPCLNDVMRPLRGGDAVIVAARPDAGKTTFLTHNLAVMATQTSLPIIWLNNESKKERILKRSLQSALNATNSELVAKQRAGTMLDEYLSVVGSRDKFRVYDIHGWTSYQVEELLETIGDVAVVVFDMLDNVKFPTSRSSDRTDQILEHMYQWARELSVKIDAPVLATSQVSNEGSGLQFPLEHMLKDSKTGKQGACDVILMIGKSDDPMLENSRFLSVPKNKLKIEGSETLMEEVLFDRDRGRYIER